MKRILTLCLTAAIAVSLVGCSGDKSGIYYSQSDNSSVDYSKPDNGSMDYSQSDKSDADYSKPESTVVSSVDLGSDKYSKIQDAILEYVNEDILTMGELEGKMLESYSSVSGTNYINDEIMYNELVSTTIPTIKQLNDEAIRVGNNLTTPELITVHKKYIDYTSELNAAFTMMQLALERQDIDMITKANDRLVVANNAVSDWKAQILTLAEQYGVSIG